MKRKTTTFISTILDKFVPPIIRERRWFYKFILKFAVGGDVDAYLDFRDNVWKMSPEDIQNFYKSVYSNIKRPTDCNEGSISRILSSLAGRTVLEYGCGRGYLAEKILQNGYNYTGVDFNTIDVANNDALKAGTFIEATDLKGLREKDMQFDIVVCTHTLEHVLDIRATVVDLLAVTKKRLLIVIPLQLNLFYTPDLHTYFFRRPGDFFIAAGITGEHDLEYHIDGGDLFVCIKVSS